MQILYKIFKSPLTNFLLNVPPNRIGDDPLSQLVLS